MKITELSVITALSKVKDPTTGKDVISMNMIENLKIEGENVSFSLVLPSMAAPSKAELNFACVSAINEVHPAANVHVHMMSKANPAATGKPESAVPHIKNVIAVASGKGGVGKSTVSVNLALGLKKLGAKVGLIDADLYGPSIPTMLGLQGQRPKIQDVYGKPKIVPLEAYGIPVMSIGFIIEPEQAVVLRGPRLAAVLKQFFNDCLWPDLDYLVIDLPPSTGDIQLTLVQTVPVTGTVMVTTPQEVAIADAIKAMNMFLLPNVNVPILGVVENMAWFTPPELPNKKYYLFGKDGGKRLVKMSKSMLLGQIPIVEAVREGGDSGKPIVLNDSDPQGEAFLNIAKNVARQIAIRNEQMEPTRKVQME